MVLREDVNKSLKEGNKKINKILQKMDEFLEEYQGEIKQPKEMDRTGQDLKMDIEAVKSINSMNTGNEKSR